ncbi:signal transduction histidine kinase [Lysinibacillus composti]|uniref:histidine kinase n=1 Tax=Lysinibacillus composti TaxID=720633 RepID=A0A3N9URS9_9BACI|nr:sensor histidine kinase [Lysinibacillus composti]MBM7608680.1 signal transduction histidine kinase [Lysinibacillus composti]RQW74596.1 sensor histidine kinase [Lysinibacillus composti]
MSLRLFIKENISFVIFELIVVLFILSLYWLDGFRNIDTAVYSVVISIVLITSFLAARFIMRKNYLNRIVHLPNSMEDALQKNAKSPEHSQTEDYFHELYRLYQHEVQTLYAVKNRHDQFLNQWIHQMKTPISVLELLLQEGDPLDKKSVQEEVDRLKRGIEMVLMNARLENFEEDMQVEQVHLKQIVNATINENKRLFITHRVFPETKIDEDLIVASDSKWLRFVLGQFVTNAVKYTFEPNKKVLFFAEKTDSSITLTIKDEGIGIPQSDISRVTKPFFTGENGRKTGESTGMGLFLAKEICEKLNHELIITSQVGVGTTITLIFK